jgi:hypothetical protein
MTLAVCAKSPTLAESEHMAVSQRACAHSLPTTHRPCQSWPKATEPVDTTQLVAAESSNSRTLSTHSFSLPPAKTVKRTPATQSDDEKEVTSIHGIPNLLHSKFA